MTQIKTERSVPSLLVYTSPPPAPHPRPAPQPTPTSQNSFSQGTSPGQSLLRNANHATQNDSSSQNTFHLSSTSHQPLNHFRQASLNGNPKSAGFHKPPNSAHVPLAASGVPEPSSAAFAWAGRGWGGPRREESTVTPSGSSPGPAASPAERTRGPGLPRPRRTQQARGHWGKWLSVAWHLPPHVGQAAPHPPRRAPFPAPGAPVHSAPTRRSHRHAPSHGPAGICGHPHRPAAILQLQPCGHGGLLGPPGSSGTLTPAGRPSRERGGGGGAGDDRWGGAGPRGEGAEPPGQGVLAADRKTRGSGRGWRRCRPGRGPGVAGGARADTGR